MRSEFVKGAFDGDGGADADADDADDDDHAASCSGR